jgi:hypothetical protein
MFLEGDMRAPPTIDVVRRACIAGFNMKGFDCNILETERGPPIENLNELKNLNGTFFVRFIHKQYTVTLKASFWHTFGKILFNLS